MGRHPDRSAVDRDTNEPCWKHLFPPGEFHWAFNMRRGDARTFFAPQSPAAALLKEKRRWLETRPELCIALTPTAEPLITASWQLALDWGHATLPMDGRCDLPTLARQWEPDLLLMDRDTMSLVAGCVCFPSSWDLRKAIGKPMHTVHKIVPRLNRQIGDQIGRFLRQLQPGKAFRRENWSFTRTAERNYHPALNRQRLDDSAAIDEMFLRVEQQLVTAIPGGILMGLRIETCPLADLATDEEAWESVREKVRTMPADVAEYKSLHDAQPAILLAMDACRPRQ